MQECRRLGLIILGACGMVPNNVSRTLKIHFFTAESTFAPIVEHTFPQVYDIKIDPDENAELWNKEGYSHLWVTKPVMEILTNLKNSMQEYPNIEPG